ncbi:MAG: hypothetical protein V5A33_06890, partial [Halobacteriales archaeon]
ALPVVDVADDGQVLVRFVSHVWSPASSRQLSAISLKNLGHCHRSPRPTTRRAPDFPRDFKP